MVFALMLQGYLIWKGDTREKMANFLPVLTTKNTRDVKIVHKFCAVMPITKSLGCGLKKGLSHPEGKFVADDGTSLQKPVKPHEPEWSTLP